jgi:dTDP-4-amino-4,6-dideoxygalactose transaminase
LVNQTANRSKLSKHLAAHGIQATSHYECLHTTPLAKKFARTAEGGLPVTLNAVASILRMPLFVTLSDESVNFIIQRVCEFFY